MSDSENDYMSLKYLVDCPSSDIRPGLLVNKEKRKFEMYKKKIESTNKRQKTNTELEREHLDKGLSTAITSDNKGYKMLEKMGFKPGDSLGKSKAPGAGIKEPINIVLKQGTSGIGHETHIKESLVKRQQRRILNLKHTESQYRMANRERKMQSQLRKDFFKAQQVCEELDYRNNIKNPVEEFYWTKDTIKKRRKLLNKQTVENSSDTSDEDDEDFELFITEQNLFVIIDYIRSQYLYCLYCAITGNDVEDLRENCPGPYRLDHDDDND